MLKSKVKKTVFNSLLVTVFIFMSAVLVAQGPPGYFHQRSIYSAGMGFGGGLGGPGIAHGLLPGYTGIVLPGFRMGYEFYFDTHWGVGALLSFSTASYKNNSISYNLDPAGNYYSRAFSDNISATYSGLGGQCYYHFIPAGSFDPYAGIITGYTFTVSSETTTFRQTDYNTHSFYPGILLGVMAGARYFVSKQIGIWAELSSSGVPDYLANVGICFKM